MNADERVQRREAREAILAAATTERLRLDRNAVPYTMRHIQRAVCVVRRRRLVPANTLILAGFNPARGA